MMWHKNKLQYKCNNFVEELELKYQIIVDDSQILALDNWHKTKSSTWRSSNRWDLMISWKHKIF